MRKVKSRGSPSALKQRVVAIDLDENVDDLVVGPLGIGGVGDVEVIAGDLLGGMTADGDIGGDLIAAGEDLELTREARRRRVG